VVCIQNHDQVGNRAMGDRFGTLLPPAAQRLACALLLLSPFTPLILMGEEYGETRPFPYFCSFGDAGTQEAVRRGRRREFEQELGKAVPASPDPQAEETFRGAKLSWQWPEGSPQAAMRRLYAALLAARRQWPALARRQRAVARCAAEGGESGDDILILQRGNGILAIANCTARPRSTAGIDFGNRRLLLSTAARQFGGARTDEDTLVPLYPFEMQIYGAESA
jgi:maltooligosyltrehalose trehalohydrolase